MFIAADLRALSSSFIAGSNEGSALRPICRAKDFIPPIPPIPPPVPPILDPASPAVFATLLAFIVPPNSKRSFNDGFDWRVLCLLDIVVSSIFKGFAWGDIVPAGNIGTVPFIAAFSALALRSAALPASTGISLPPTFTFASPPPTFGGAGAGGTAIPKS